MKIKNIIMALALILTFGSSIPLSAQAATVGGLEELCGIDANKSSDICKDYIKSTDNQVGLLIARVLKTMLFIIGALSVVMIVYAGFNFVTSAGDSGKVNKAKGVILYAVIGLVVSLLAYAIVSFVTSSIAPASTVTRKPSGSIIEE